MAPKRGEKKMPVQWVPSQMGIIGNERADQESKETCSRIAHTHDAGGTDSLFPMSR